MQKIELFLKNEKRQLYDRFAILLLILNGIAVCFFPVRLNYQELSQKRCSFAILAISLFMAGILIFSKSIRQKKYSFIITSVSIVLYWLLMWYWWIALIMLVLLSLYAITTRELKVFFDNGRIDYPSFPKRTLSWIELNNVVLKDGLLTIDLANNRIIQQYIEESPDAINEKEFNEFCRQQLTKAASSI